MSRLRGEDLSKEDEMCNRYVASFFFSSIQALARCLVAYVSHKMAGPIPWSLALALITFLMAMWRGIRLIRPGSNEWNKSMAIIAV